MDLMDLASLLISLAALFSFINHRYIRLPTSIGIMLIALVFSLGMLLFEYLGWSTAKHAHRLLGSVDFDETLFSDGIGVVLFIALLGLAAGSQLSVSSAALMVLENRVLPEPGELIQR
jgi:CPA1 family monovalent cation:H+ antiporter